MIEEYYLREPPPDLEELPPPDRLPPEKEPLDLELPPLYELPTLLLDEERVEEPTEALRETEDELPLLTEEAEDLVADCILLRETEEEDARETAVLRLLLPVEEVTLLPVLLAVAVLLPDEVVAEREAEVVAVCRLPDVADD